MRLVCSSVACLLLLGVPAFGQTAGLTSKMIAGGGLVPGYGVVPGVRIRLESEQDPSRNISTESDAHGNWSLTNLFPGEYMLRAFRPGFDTFTVRGIRIVDGEQKILPPLRLNVGFCGSSPVVKYIQFLDSETVTGDFGARIQLDEGPMKGDTQGITGAEVRLLCGRDVVCGTTMTDHEGEFRFTGLTPGEFNIQVSRKGFYPVRGAAYRVDAGVESIYYPIYLEKCSRGDCKPSKRPKKPLAICE
jgi:hypothetical protein